MLESKPSAACGFVKLMEGRDSRPSAHISLEN
jgi:hypothetical protein